ncbi:fasciclin domain-containing protein [Salegentibacter salegens]|uniref:Uncaracterized surface protein containing fasciclin (FAS1) repeats n=1 Tax=Salegentibacter salegens TaxID=143223 RepID=A0A1M7K243_9FLAO|nr:fasciclin domain-containing protein [Salegentibacter salegens]PRX41930.1 putative surface protein with fasciclin (FAS1) repeats [Salegentibacter salegens]SHM59295.1 Uncaracterized surface protein containing fasciclin (FAS1) repeats [Salegentibacter salegens]
MKTIKFTKLAVLAFLAFGLFSCSDDDDGGDVITPTNTIADFVAENDDYSSLAAALEVTGLDVTLDGSANYTVFAPNNAAFNSFLSTNGFSSLEEVPVDILTEILLNHVQEGEITSGALSTGYIESMATGMASDSPLSLYINTADGVRINGVSSVTTADVQVDNGVIHAVDAVIGLPDVTTFATADPNFDILVQALTREESFNFVETLMATEDPAPFTVFAPTNDAFVALLNELGAGSLADIPTATLEAVLGYHVVAGANVRSGDLSDDMMVETLQGGEFTVNLGDNVVITDERGRTSIVIAADVQATNGVIHALDTVLLPAE